MPSLRKELGQILAVLGNQLTFNPCTARVEVLQVVNQNDVSAITRSDSSSAFKLPALGGVDRRHADRGNRVNAKFHAHLQMAVDVAFIKKCLRLAVI